MAQTRIMIVDDDSLIRLDLHDMLERMGYLVVGEAGDAQSAINAARALRPDLVIMDIRMGGELDGIDAAKLLTAEQIGPVLLLTAFSDIELVRRAKEAGVVGYVLKPFSEAELRATVEVTLARFQERQALERESIDLREELETRKLVERAKGVLMNELKVSEAEAYNRIQKASMNTRKPMRDIAEAILLSKQISG
jgi:AmiR/NasT family two-component response regulator